MKNVNTVDFDPLVNVTVTDEEDKDRTITNVVTLKDGRNELKLSKYRCPPTFTLIRGKCITLQVSRIFRPATDITTHVVTKNLSF